MECQRYHWCRGIRISGPSSEHFEKCRLLTNHKTNLPGWTFFNGGNWVEPKDWKETKGVTCKNVFSQIYRCYEKISTGKSQIRVL